MGTRGKGDRETGGQGGDRETGGQGGQGALGNLLGGGWGAYKGMFFRFDVF